MRQRDAKPVVVNAGKICILQKYIDAVFLLRKIRVEKYILQKHLQTRIDAAKLQKTSFAWFLHDVAFRRYAVDVATKTEHRFGLPGFGVKCPATLI